MYTARYNDDQTVIVQTALSVEKVVFESNDGPDSWLARYRAAISDLIFSPGVDFAFRINLTDSSLKRELFIMASEERQEHLQALADRFLRLNGLVAESVEPCLDKKEHDDMAASFPSLQASVSSATHSYNGCQLICDFRLFQLLERLFDAALQRKWNVAVQFNVRRYLPTPDDRRALKKNLVQIEAEGCLPTGLAELQRLLAGKMDQARFLVDQFIGFGSAQAQAFLSEQISDEFTAKFGKFGFPCTPFGELGDNIDEQVVIGFHSSWFQELEPMEKAAQALLSNEIEELLCWQPRESAAAGVLKNAQIGHERDRDFLQRIEVKLGELERALQTRQLAMAECSELKKALNISRADPPFALVKTRQILEGIIQRVYKDRKRGQPGKPLFNMIDELLEDGRVFPRRIGSYLHTLRVLGNLVAHGGSTKSEGSAESNSLSESDVELVLLMTLNLVEWYLFEYPASDAK